MSERQVRVNSIGEDRSIKDVGAAVDQSLVSWEPMKFEQKTYKHFHAEYDFTAGNYVVHFFVPPDMVNKHSERELEMWWQNDFAESLSSVAQEHFKATIPRIMAKYTTENASWWFKAQGYGTLIDPTAYLLQFFEKLDDSFLPAPAP